MKPASASDHEQQRPHGMNVRDLNTKDVLIQDLWQDSLNDNMGNEKEAKQQYDRIIQSVARQQAQRRANSLPNPVAKRARISSRQARNVDSEVEDSETVSSSNSGSSGNSKFSLQSDSEQSEGGDKASIELIQNQAVKWMKPGVLSRSLGVSQCVLRNWAKSNLVRTMVSPGGHRLFNIKSVQQHMKAAEGLYGTGKVKAHDQASLASGQRQIVVYIRLDSNLDHAQLQSASEQIQGELRQQLQSSCTKNELQNSLLIFELETVSSRTSERNAGHLADTLGTKRLLQAICNRKNPAGLLVVLRVADDISCVPSTYSLFMLLCRSMGVTVQIIPDLIKSIPN